MLSSRSSPTIDGGPLRPSPVQGHHQLHAERPRYVAPLPIHIPVTAPAEAHLSETPSQCAPAPLSRPSKTLGRHDSCRSVDSCSPKIHSPLRNSTSYNEFSDSDSPTPTPDSIQHSRDTLIAPTKMAFTGDRRPSAPDGISRNRLNDWFGLGIVPESEQSTFSKPPLTRSRSVASQGGRTASFSANSRFAMFANPVSAFKERTTPAPQSEGDELMDLDIQSALLPTTSADGAAFSPAAFKNLQMTATGLLKKYQEAYRQRTYELRELKAEQDVQAEEVDEADVRARHLKMQLEDMARKAAEQEEQINSLLQELTEEKKLRLEEQNAREKAIAASETSTIYEDLGAEEDQNKRHWRRSDATTKSDMSLDTDEESIGDVSVFSRSRSPTVSISIAQEENISPIEVPASVPKTYVLGPSYLVGPSRPTRSSSSQMGAFQKLFKGGSSGSQRDDDILLSKCRKCQDATVAWDTVNLLKYENKGLKERVEELESTVESVLDVVNGLNL